MPKSVTISALFLFLLLIGCSDSDDNGSLEGPLPPTPDDMSISATPLVADVWIPAPGTSWEWQLTGPIDLSVEADVWDIDMLENDAGVVDELHARGSRVICYISVGTWEEPRPDADRFPDEVLGEPLEDHPDERWLDIRRLDLLGPIMEARLDECRDKGFDGVEFDNVDGYDNDSGFPLTYEDQLAYNRFLANEAHKRGLSAALKNDLEQIPDLLDFFDFAINEECFQYHECDALLPFIEAGKAVFAVEYELAPDEFCDQANAMRFSAMRKDPVLDAYREVC